MCLFLLLKVSDSRFKVVVKAREQNSLNLHAFILNSSKRSVYKDSKYAMQTTVKANSAMLIKLFDLIQSSFDNLT